MGLAAGSRLGPYEITGPLGAGGMGEVYRARDTKLGRDVALKILPEAFAGDPDRLARFEREAKTLAALNHPHIAHIHGFEDSGKTRALVMELVEGEDLSQRIARGPIPPDEALPIARQIADALEAAHEQGIIHRDLKPANIKVRADGTVKVLDFGLAKALTEESGAGASPANSPTITSPMTLRGMILGTAAYMSPEQAKGTTVDKRADIWAFGCVFYEMLSGTPLFDGETASETIADVLRKPIDLRTLPSSTPAHVRRVIERCLERDPRNRLRDIGDARVDLTAPATAAAVEQPRAGVPRVTWVLGVVALASLALAARLALRPGPDAALDRRGPVHFSVAQPGLSIFADANISPDGARIVFDGSDGSTRRLWTRSLDAPVAVPIPNAEGGRLPVWSPDGSEVAFFNARGIVAVQVASGRVRTIVSNARPAPDAGSMTWGADGTILVLLAGETTTLARISAATGAVTPVAKGAEILYPSLLPTGTHFLYTARKADANATGIAVAPISDPSQGRVLVDAPSRGVYANGHLLYVRDGTLMAHPFDIARLALAGDPIAIADGVAYFRPNGRSPFWAAAGTVVYIAPPPDVDATMMDRSGTVLATIGQPGLYDDLALSPDGTAVVIGLNDRRTGLGDLHLYDLARKTSTNLTRDQASEGSTLWSADGRSIVYGSDRNGGPPDVYMLDLASGADARRIWSAPGNQYPRAWLPDGRLLINDADEPTGNSPVLTLGPTTTRAILQPPVPLSPPRSQPDVSPDGRWIAFSAPETGSSGRAEIFVQPLGRPGARVRVSSGGGVAPFWRKDGGELFYSIIRDMMVAKVTTGEQFSFTPPTVLFSLDRPVSFYEVTPDGQRFLVVPGPPPGFSPMHVVVNWNK